MEKKLTRDEMLARRKALEEIVGQFDYDDPNYDDKRAFILFNAKDPNATFESLENSAPSPEILAKMEAEAAKRNSETDFALWFAETAE